MNEGNVRFFWREEVRVNVETKLELSDPKLVGING